MVQGLVDVNPLLGAEVVAGAPHAVLACESFPYRPEGSCSRQNESPRCLCKH